MGRLLRESALFVLGGEAGAVDGWPLAASRVWGFGCRAPARAHEVMGCLGGGDFWLMGAGVADVATEDEVASGVVRGGVGRGGVGWRRAGGWGRLVTEGLRGRVGWPGDRSLCVSRPSGRTESAGRRLASRVPSVRLGAVANRSPTHRAMTSSAVRLRAPKSDPSRDYLESGSPPGTEVRPIAR